MPRGESRARAAYIRRMKRRSTCPGLLAGILAAACGSGASAPELSGVERARADSGSRDPIEAGPLVAFRGDSITAGLHLAEDEAYPGLLRARLAAEGVPIRIVNAGVSGDTTAGGLRRLDWVLQRAPDVLVVELGGNDGLRGVPLASIEENLDALVARAKERGTRVLLLGMRLPPSYGAGYTRGFAEIYPRVAEKHGVELAPFFMEKVGGVAELNLEDGLHPNARGHEVLAEAVLPALKRVLGTVER